MTREHVVISFDAVFKKVSSADADCHRQHFPIPNCVAVLILRDVLRDVSLQKNRLLNLIIACIAMVNKWWRAARAWGVKTKAVLSVLECEYRREFQSPVVAVEPSEV